MPGGCFSGFSIESQALMQVEAMVFKYKRVFTTILTYPGNGETDQGIYVLYPRLQ